MKFNVRIGASPRVAPLAATIVLAACAGAPETMGHLDERESEQRHAELMGERAASVALDQVGVPYRFGGSTPAGFDCSGLVHYAYLQVGKQLPRTTSRLWHSVYDVDPDLLLAGDLLFFRIDGKMAHVGLYVGNGRFVHAPTSGRHVQVESLQSAYYADAFMRAGRPR
jgi:cell wall-associated NlpC family hydrolase